MTIQVNNLPPQVAEADLNQLFSEYGSVQKIEIFESVASVTLNGDEEEEAATRALSGKDWGGHILELELVLDDGSRDPGGPP